MICAIDPMDKGALCFLQDNPVLYDMPVIPVTPTRVEVDIPQLYSLIAEHRPSVIVTELLRPMPKGGNANFKLGGYLYLIRTIAHILGIPCHEVSPKAWQKTFCIKNSKESTTKQQSYLIASRLFPDAELTREPRTKRGASPIVLDGRSDALLIAEYARRTLSLS